MSYDYEPHPEPSGSFLGREPALWIGVIGALVSLAIGFGVDITTEQFGLIMAAVSAVLGLVTRSQVSPKAPGA